jgi:hypothetical protein
MEMRRYQELRLLEVGGVIQDLRLQPKYLLLEGYRQPGTNKRVRPIYYIADFAYVDQATGETIVEDVKGYQTPVFRIKRKLFESRYGLELRLVQA